MSDFRVPVRRWTVRIVVTVVVLVGLALTAGIIARRVQVRMWAGGLTSAEASARTRSLYRIGTDPDPLAADAVLTVLEREQNREVLEAAGYAAMRVGDLRGVALLRTRADAGPDDPARARLIWYAARLSQRDARLADWLNAGAKSSEPWRQVGSAVGLMELGMPEGGRILLDLAREAGPDVRDFALAEFRRIAVPMAQTIGQPTDAWPSPGAAGSSDAGWKTVQAFWQQHADIRLLNDVLTRLYRKDPQWAELKRLMHARDRLAGWLN